jgi:hypothetical protein
MEIDRALGFISTVKSAATDAADAEQVAWSRLLQALFASTEFRLLD